MLRFQHIFSKIYIVPIYYLVVIEAVHLSVFSKEIELDQNLSNIITTSAYNGVPHCLWSG